MPRRTTTALLSACVALAACGGGSGSGGDATYTVRSIKRGFVTRADLGKDLLAFQDTEHSNHIIYTPTDSVPTCPYVQRADTVTNGVQPSIELDGGNSTARFI